LFVPTGFTPDATDNNILYVRSPRIATLDFHIFDRWGKEVFVSNSASIGWEGRDKSGTKVNAGVYVYYANATFLDGKARTIHGNVTLLR
jgi:gliding motility-associated-like protein